MNFNLPNIRKNLQTFWGFLILSLLVLGLAASVILVTERQEIRKEAAGIVPCKVCKNGDCIDNPGLKPNEVCLLFSPNVCEKNKECRRCEAGTCVRKNYKVENESRQCGANTACRACEKQAKKWVCVGKDVRVPTVERCGEGIKIGEKCTPPTPTPTSIPCTPEGQTMPVYPGYECCSGLNPISTAKPDANGNCPLKPPLGASVCAKCGNGVCGLGENKCNCSKDCAPIPCTRKICRDNRCITISVTPPPGVEPVCPPSECSTDADCGAPTPTPTGTVTPTPTGTVTPTPTATPTPACWLTGDFNCDGEVDLLDFEIFRDIYVEHL